MVIILLTVVVSYFTWRRYARNNESREAKSYHNATIKQEHPEDNYLTFKGQQSSTLHAGTSGHHGTQLLTPVWERPLPEQPDTSGADYSCLGEFQFHVPLYTAPVKALKPDAAMPTVMPTCPEDTESSGNADGSSLMSSTGRGRCSIASSNGKAECSAVSGNASAASPMASDKNIIECPIESDTLQSPNECETLQCAMASINANPMCPRVTSNVYVEHE